MQIRSPESDPAIDEATRIEYDLSQRFELENQKRIELAAILAEERVPTYEQMQSALDWTSETRNTGTFDSDGNLVQHEGLVPVTEANLTDLEKYFEPARWELTPRELAVAKSITDTYHSDKLDKLKTLARVSPRFGAELSKDLAGVPTIERLNRIEAMVDDTHALIKLDLAIKRSRDASAKPGEVKDSMLEKGFFGLNTVKALHELQRDEGLIEENIRSDEETVTGMTYKQKNQVLEHFGHKEKVQKTSEKDPSFQASDAERTGALSDGLRKIGISRLPSRGGDRKEKIRRFVNGTENRPSVAARHKLEADITLAEGRLAEGGLSSSERRRLEKRAEKAKAKIASGSFINPNKYGEAVSQQGAERESETYDPKKLRDSVHKIHVERDNIEDGNFARQIHAALGRESKRPPTNTDIRFNQETFNEVLTAISDRFDRLIEIHRTIAKAGERIKDHQIDSVYVASQLSVAREIASDYFKARGMNVNETTRSKYVRQLLEAFHAYTPSVPDVDKPKSQTRPTPAVMPRKKPTATRTTQRSNSRKSGGAQAVNENAQRTAYEA